MLPNSDEAPPYQQGTKALFPRVTDNIHSRAISEQIFIQICSSYAATVLGSKSWSAMGTSWVGVGGDVQCLRIHLPVQWMQVRSLVKDAAGQLNWHVQQKNPRAATKTRCSQKKGSVSCEESEHGPALREPVLAAPPATLYPPTPHHFPILPPSVRPRKENIGRATYFPHLLQPCSTPCPTPHPAKGLHSSCSPSWEVTPPAPCAC